MPFDREKAAALLKSDAYLKASPEVKSAIVARLRKEAADAGVATPRDTVSATPKMGAKDYLQIALGMPQSPAAKSAVLTGIDKALPFLPAIGATAGGLAASPGIISGPVGAGEGAVIGEGARAVLNRAIFGEHIDPAEEAKNLIEQGALGTVTEFGARGAGSLGSRLLKPFTEASQAMKAAKAGTGVRMTPGEAVGSPTLRRIEEVLGHLPGSGGPMETFREAQISEAKKLMSDRVNALSQSRMEDFQAGNAVHSALDQVVKARTSDINLKYGEVKKLLGVDPKAFMTPEQIDEAVSKKIEFYKSMNGGTPPVVAKLAEARKAARAAANAPDGDVIARILKGSPEEVVSDVQNKYTLAELREFNQVVPPQARQQVAANVLQKMLYDATDAQNGAINQRQLAESLKKLGDVRGALIFGKEYAAVREGSALLNRIAPMATNGTGGLGKMHNLRMLMEVGGVAGSALAFSGHATTAAAAVGGPLLAMRAISFALTHPRTSAFMLKVLRGAAVSASRAIPYGVDAALISPADVHTTQAAQ